MASVCINEDSELQVQSYLRFAKGKREENMREVDLTFSDVREYKLLDSVYTKDDVRAMVDEIHEEVKATVEKELENNTHVAAAMLKTLLSQAEDVGYAQLSIDTNMLEDMKLLQEIRAIEKVALSRPATDFARGATQRHTLGKIPDVPRHHTRLKEENAQLKREIANLREKFIKLQGQSIDAVKEKNTFRSAFETAQSSADDVAALNAELETSNAELAALNAELAVAKDELAALKDELAAAKREASGRLQESSQFQQMKKMMMHKTKELQAARKKLVKFEPENESDVRSADLEEDEFAA